MMRLTSLDVTDFQGIKVVHLQPQPFTMVCGQNWAGKTSLQQAVRLALTGEIARASLKKNELRQLVRDGTERAEVFAKWDGNSRAALIKDAATGHTIPGDEVVAPEVLDMHRLSRATPDERKAALFRLLSIEVDPENVRRKLLQRGGHPDGVEHLMGLLPAGFDAMALEAEKKAAECRGAWKAVTGKTYGSEQGEVWVAEPPEGLPTAQKAAKDRIQVEEAIEKISAQLAECEPRVTAMRLELRQAGAKLTCPHCGKPVSTVTEERAAQLAVDLPEEENSLSFIQQALSNRRQELSNLLRTEEQIRNGAQIAADRTAEAKRYHGGVVQWKALRDLCQPGGVPADMLSDALGPLNNALRGSAEALQLGLVTIGADMAVRLNGRLYGLLSEAEQWITDCQLVVALAQVTGQRFCMLDRLDVLDVQKRSAAVAWLLQQTRATELQVLAFATLKQLPDLGKGSLCVWLENGEIAA